VEQLRIKLSRTRGRKLFKVRWLAHEVRPSPCTIYRRLGATGSITMGRSPCTGDGYRCASIRGDRHGMAALWSALQCGKVFSVVVNQ
jgi:hypothetical protein